MAKRLIKEIIIMLLLCLAILLILGILLYEYAPISKTIPNPVSYTTPEEVKQELADTSTIDENQIILTYEIDATDLSNYTKIQKYKPGKANPFSSYATTEISGTNTTVGSSQTGGSKDTNTSSSNTTNTAEENTTTSGRTIFPR